jgi:hypothetical protein
VLALVVAFLLLAGYSLRPWLLGHLLLALWIAALELPRSCGRWRPLAVAALFALWANVHGSVALGLAVAAVYVVEAAATRAGAAALRARGRDLGVALAASFATPFGARGLALPLTYARLALSGDRGFLGVISEWERVAPWSPLGLALLAVAGGCVVAVLGSSRAPRPAQVVLAACGAALAFAAVRDAPLLGLMATPLLARHLPGAASRVWRAALGRSVVAAALGRARERSLAVEAGTRGLRSHLLLPAAVLGALAVAATLPRSSPLALANAAGATELVGPSRSYPRELIGALRATRQGLRVFNHLDWGGAIVWSAGPRHRVFIDQRNDCYPPDVLRDYLAVHRLEPGWREVLDRRRVDAVAYPAASRLAAALRREPAWRLVHEDAQAALFVRSRAP